MAVSLRQADLTNGVSRDRTNRRNGRASAALGREVSDYADPPETGQIQICLAFAPRCLLALIFPANLMLSFSASASAVMLSHPQIAVSNVGRGANCRETIALPPPGAGKFCSIPCIQRGTASQKRRCR